MWTVVWVVTMSRLLQHHRDRGDVDEGQEVRCFLFVPRGDAAELLRLRPESLHQVSLFVRMAVILTRFQAILLRWNHGRRAASFDGRDKTITVVAFVANHCVRFVVGEQLLRLTDIRGLTGRQLQHDGMAEAVETPVNLRTESAPA